MSSSSLRPSTWKLLEALIVEQARHATGYPSAAPVFAQLGMSIDEGRDHLDELAELDMAQIHARSVPHFDVLWRGREEAAKRGLGIASPVADANKLLELARSLENGTKQVHGRDLVHHFGWEGRRGLDAAQVLESREEANLRRFIGGSFTIILTARGRRRP